MNSVQQGGSANVQSFNFQMPNISLPGKDYMPSFDPAQRSSTPKPKKVSKPRARKQQLLQQQLQMLEQNVEPSVHGQTGGLESLESARQQGIDPSSHPPLSAFNLLSYAPSKRRRDVDDALDMIQRSLDAAIEARNAKDSSMTAQELTTAQQHEHECMAMSEVHQQHCVQPAQGSSNSHRGASHDPNDITHEKDSTCSEGKNSSTDFVMNELPKEILGDNSDLDTTSQACPIVVESKDIAGAAESNHAQDTHIEGWGSLADVERYYRSCLEIADDHLIRASRELPPVILCSARARQRLSMQIVEMIEHYSFPVQLEEVDQVSEAAQEINVQTVSTVREQPRAEDQDGAPREESATTVVNTVLQSSQAGRSAESPPASAAMEVLRASSNGKEQNGSELASNATQSPAQEEPVTDKNHAFVSDSHGLLEAGRSQSHQTAEKPSTETDSLVDTEESSAKQEPSGVTSLSDKQQIPAAVECESMHEEQVDAPFASAEQK